MPVAVVSLSDSVSSRGAAVADARRAPARASAYFVDAETTTAPAEAAVGNRVFEEFTDVSMRSLPDNRLCGTSRTGLRTVA